MFIELQVHIIFLGGKSKFLVSSPNGCTLIHCLLLKKITERWNKI